MGVDILALNPPPMSTESLLLRPYARSNLIKVHVHSLRLHGLQ